MIAPKWLRKRRQYESECARYPQRLILSGDLHMDPVKYAESIRIWRQTERNLGW